MEELLIIPVTYVLNALVLGDSPGKFLGISWWTGTWQAGCVLLGTASAAAPMSIDEYWVLHSDLDSLNLFLVNCGAKPHMRRIGH